jgi:hypothetical protein
MKTPQLRGPLLVACLLLDVVGCGRSSSGAGPSDVSGTYSSIDDEELQIEFRPGNTVVAVMGGEEGDPGTYTIEGEKVLVTFNGQQITFIRDGSCIEDVQKMFGRMCKGGRAGNAANVSTRTAPVTTGAWEATNQDGAFLIEFQSGTALRLSASMSDGSQSKTSEGRFSVEGDTLYATLADSTPMVLQWVNNGYESTAFGLPMRFTRK